MKKFMDKNFLLETKTAQKLFFDYAAKMPIIDYHCHINPQEIAEDKKFKNITEAWLGGDHYKWRLIRSNGVDEAYITGTTTTDKEKFDKFAEALSRSLGNPLYHWTHLELQRYFGVTKPLSPATADEIWKTCNALLKKPKLSVQGIIKSSNVKVICTTDDPISDLKWHKKIAKDGKCSAKVYPAMRPDKALHIAKPGWAKYMAELSEVAGEKPVTNIAGIRKVLGQRLDYFGSMGCRATDHALEYAFCRIATDAKVNSVIKKVLAGKAITQEESEMYETAILLFLGEQYADRGWAMEIHYSALRDANSKMYKAMGPDTGFDCIDLAPQDNCKGLAEYMDALNSKNKLPKMIIFSLNPNDNAMIGALIGCFQGPEVRGKIQQGASWWFNDTKRGMLAQLDSIADLSIVGNILGMLTDSRSFLSYTRHEYYRRILCNWIGNKVENGEYPADMKFLGQMVEDICYNNAAKYFGFTD
ncbi:MAG: glucuronate isomerase [Acidaminococcaceae bacterium]|jgi:glucuronate isomerase|nr:glucuronate isomerase [Acidaminococcaceae bacterium]